MFSQPHRLDVKRSAGSAGGRQLGSSASELQRRQRQQQAQMPDQPDKPEQQMGEGSYEGTRDYQENIKSYLDKADVKSDAEAAKPATPEEAQALKKAEDEALAHTKAPGQ